MSCLKGGKYSNLLASRNSNNNLQNVCLSSDFSFLKTDKRLLSM